MVRLILLAAPIAAVCGGIALGYAWAWSIGGIFGEARPSLENLLFEDVEDGSSAGDEEEELIQDELEPATPAKGSKNNGKSATKDLKKKKIPGKKKVVKQEVVVMSKSGDPLWVRVIRIGLGLYAIREALPMAEDFKAMCHQVAHQISHPTIITKGTNRQTGQSVVVDDYREAYFWLRDNTPEDARIMAWWDYGYQITGIGNRTTIADGNTWNHEHIGE